MRGTLFVGRLVRRRGRWNVEEMNRLRELYGLKDEAWIAREIGRPVESVRAMAERLFRGPRRTGPWTVRELQALRLYVGVAAPDTIAQILRRTPQEVRRRIAELGRRRPRTGSWARDELNEFKRLFGTREDGDLARVFGRSLPAIRAVARRLCLSKDKAFVRQRKGQGATRMPRWDRGEEDLLRRLYATLPNLEIARRLGRSVKSVVSKAHDLGLQKSTSRLAEMGRENVAVRYGKGSA
ncbi:MAG TPA: hypothetical protein VFI25_00660 [Planctomycetota bacterium]|jgi:hypothetical protein|nr:hypothetical protein [Planctomycetota bacterium]